MVSFIRRHVTASRTTAGVLVIIGFLVILGASGGSDTGGSLTRGLLIALAGLVLMALGCILYRATGHDEANRSVHSSLVTHVETPSTPRSTRRG